MNFPDMSVFASLSGALQNFHFIRPYWLLMLVPALLMVALLYQREKHRNAWQQYIDPELLTPLLLGKVNRAGNKVPVMAFLFWLITALALAGPSWEKLPTPVEKRDSALIILLDLSPSMLASDVAPSRLVAARHKILDLLKLRREGYTGLIAYSGDAHIVSPLTDDTQTIANLLNGLDPGIMPVYGSNLEDALTKALLLFKNAAYTQGDILLISDGITEQTISQAAPILAGNQFTLTIIGLGTEAGAPIPDNAGGFLKDSKGNIVLPRLEESLLQRLADKVGGYYSPLQLNDADIQPLVEGKRILNQVSGSNDKSKKPQREFDQWRDVGGILTLCLLPLLLLTFRRGVLISLFVALPLLHNTNTWAENPAPSTELSVLSAWDSLWRNANQRAMHAMEKKDYKTAAKEFSDPNWKASAQYQAGDYASALKQFRSNSGAEALYNQGNALARSGQLQEAINAYKEALKQNPQFDDAAFNKKIVEDLLAHSEKQPKQQDSQQPPNSPDEQNSSNDPSQSQQSKDDQDNNKDKNKNGDQEQNHGDEQKNKDQQNTGEQNRDQQQTAREEKDPAHTDTEAQLEKSDSGKNQSEPSPESQLSPEQKQAMEQWLRQVPDDPSGLLRNKFEYYYQQRLQKQAAGSTDKHLNNEERW